MKRALDSLRDLKYFIHHDPKKNQVGVVYSENAGTYDIFRSYFECYLLANRNKLQKQNPSLIKVGSGPLFVEFLSQIEEKGWNTKSHLLGVGEWRSWL